MSLGFLEQNRNTILLMLVLLFALGLLVQWMAYILGKGRYSGDHRGGQSVGYVAGTFFATIINDFRHLLALVVMGVFAITLFAAMLPGLQTGDMEMIKEGVTVVAAALGGLIGSIIGYYFGESAASRTPQPSGGGTVTPSGPAMQRPAGGDGGGEEGGRGLAPAAEGPAGITPTSRPAGLQSPSPAESPTVPPTEPGA